MTQSVALNRREADHQALDNFKFYSCSKGHEILNTVNFPPEILDFLEGEQKIIQQFFVNIKREYGALLEVGCGNARNIDLSILLGLDYFGIDFIENEIIAARKKINKNKLAGQVKCLSVLDLNKTTTPVPNNLQTICLFPFNVFGNIFEPTRILKIMRELKYSMLISTYRNDAQKDAILKYYKACSLNHIDIIKLDNGTMFISEEGFKSIIYDSEYIEQISRKLNLTINSFEFSTLGKLYYIR